MFKTDFIGIGAAKCGTTWLHHCLEEHPEICMPSPKKEPGFYDNHWQDLNYYKSQFAHRRNERIIGEFTPGYLAAEGVAERIASHNPTAKLIFIVRNPIERAYSHYCMLAKSGALNDGPEAIQPETRMYKDSMYWSSFSKYAKLFPQDQILILVQEEMLSNPLSALERVFDFLNVDANFVPSLATKQIHSRSNRPGKPGLYRILVSISDLAHRARFSGMLFDKIRNMGVGKVYRMLDRGKPFPELTHEVRRYLRAEFRNEVKPLLHYLGRRIELWENDFPAE